MTKAEVMKLVTVVRAYPQYRTATQADIDNLISLWEMAISEYPYQAASAALAAFVKTDTKGFPPVPGQIIDKMVRMSSEPEGEMQVAEAFALYWNALCDSAYNAQEQFDALPEIVQRVAGSPNVLHEAAVSADTNMSVERALFEKRFAVERERMREEAKIPAAIRKLIGGMNLKALPD